MSLDCFGKVIPVGAGRDFEKWISVENPGRLIIGDLDPEDLDTICETEELRSPGITFKYVGRENGDDPTDLSGQSATGLWLSADDTGRRFRADRTLQNAEYVSALKATALGGFVWNLLYCPDIKCGALALVDGGIDTIVHGTPGECWKHFVGIMDKGWDNHDNPLLVWNT